MSGPRKLSDPYKDYEQALVVFDTAFQKASSNIFDSVQKIKLRNTFNELYQAVQASRSSGKPIDSSVLFKDLITFLKPIVKNHKKNWVDSETTSHEISLDVLKPKSDVKDKGLILAGFFLAAAEGRFPKSNDKENPFYNVACVAIEGIYKGSYEETNQFIDRVKKNNPKLFAVTEAPSADAGDSKSSHSHSASHPKAGNPKAVDSKETNKEIKKEESVSLSPEAKQYLDGVRLIEASFENLPNLFTNSVKKRFLEIIKKIRHAFNSFKEMPTKVNLLNNVFKELINEINLQIKKYGDKIGIHAGEGNALSNLHLFSKDKIKKNPQMLFLLHLRDAMNSGERSADELFEDAGIALRETAKILPSEELSGMKYGDIEYAQLIRRLNVVDRLPCYEGKEDKEKEIEKNQVISEIERKRQWDLNPASTKIFGVVRVLSKLVDENPSWKYKPTSPGIFGERDMRKTFTTFYDLMKEPGSKEPYYALDQIRLAFDVKKNPKSFKKKKEADEKAQNTKEHKYYAFYQAIVDLVNELDKILKDPSRKSIDDINGKLSHAVIDALNKNGLWNTLNQAFQAEISKEITTITPSQVKATAGSDERAAVVAEPRRPSSSS